MKLTDQDTGKEKGIKQTRKWKIEGEKLKYKINNYPVNFNRLFILIVSFILITLTQSFISAYNSHSTPYREAIPEKLQGI
jgi:hypothetical protein